MRITPTEMATFFWRDWNSLTIRRNAMEESAQDCAASRVALGKEMAS
ncbi:MAG: hypothetical protein ABI836_08855 [Gemmatimonadota bacterium]